MPDPRDQTTLFGDLPPENRRSAEPTRPREAPAPAGETDVALEGAFARVVVERGIESGEGAQGYTYRCDQPVRVGDRVRVPLGRGNTPTGGFVVEVGGPELAAGTPASKIKPVLEVTPGNMSETLLGLARWMASYYVCPLGMVLSAMLPAAVKRAAGVKTEKFLDRAAEPVSSAVLESVSKKTRELIEKVAALPTESFPGAITRLAAELGLKTAAPLKRLVELGILTPLSRDRIESRGFVAPSVTGPDAPPMLTPDQRTIVEGIAPTLDRFGVHLIRGVTGSGKTEVYLRLIERVLDAGKSAIVLVPEIALTPQTSSRFLRRFAFHGVCVLHSGLSASQRHAEWDRAARGAARVVVGARSAVFAPLAGLGLIVVDEEHDSSYKQDQLPRYHGRDAAIKRAQLEGCPALLGSATPSLESWANTKGLDARTTLWELQGRVVGAMPHVEIVDMADERRIRAIADPGSRSRQWSIGPRLETALVATLRAGGQAILLLNRRGFAHYIACTNAACGWVMGCDQCDSKLVFHKQIGLPRGGDVACHHCLARQLLPRACPHCSGPINIFGAGTQRVEEEVERIVISCGLAPETLIRADSDSMGSARDYFEALDRYGRGDARVLLGTQMIAKGLDFPNVRLVGVVSADTALALPDFRAAERTFQLVSQVAGRAGRGPAGGRVIVQTMEPTNPAIVLASRHDYITFAEQELAVRRGAGLPPATRMARIVCRDTLAPKARDAAAEIAEALRSGAGPGTRVLGPLECPVNRTHGQFRFAAEIIAPTATDLNRALATLRASGLLVSDARTAIDVDPVALM